MTHSPIFGADFWTMCHTDLVPDFFWYQILALVGCVFYFVPITGMHVTICKSAPWPRHITMAASHHSVFTGRMPFLPPTNSVKANPTYPNKPTEPYQTILTDTVGLHCATSDRHTSRIEQESGQWAHFIGWNQCSGFPSVLSHWAYSLQKSSRWHSFECIPMMPHWNQHSLITGKQQVHCKGCMPQSQQLTLVWSTVYMFPKFYENTTTVFWAGLILLAYKRVKH